MGLWLLALGMIAIAVVAGIVVTRRQPPVGPPHSLAAVLAVRLVGIVAVTVAIVAGVRLGGPLAGVVIGVAGVYVLVALLVMTGYARIPLRHR